MSFPGQFITTRVGRVFVHRAGPRGKTPIVLIHGYLMSHYAFGPMLTELERTEDVIALDLPGFGESDNPAPEEFPYSLQGFADVVVEVLHQLGVARATLVGHSLGGSVAITLAARRPEQIDKLVVLDGTVYALKLRPEVRAGLMPGFGRVLFRAAVTKLTMQLEMRRRHVRDPRVLTDDFIDYYWERYSRAGGPDAAYASFVTIATQSDNSADPGRVRAPTLLLWGEEDRVVPLYQGKRLKRAIPGAELKVVPAAGHFPYLERTDEFMRLLRPFLSDKT